MARIKSLLKKVGTAIAARKGMQVGTIDFKSGKVLWG